MFQKLRFSSAFSEDSKATPRQASILIYWQKKTSAANDVRNIQRNLWAASAVAAAADAAAETEETMTTNTAYGENGVNVTIGQGR